MWVANRIEPLRILKIRQLAVSISCARLKVPFDMSHDYVGAIFHKITKYEQPGTGFLPIIPIYNLASDICTENYNLDSQELHSPHELSTREILDILCTVL